MPNGTENSRNFQIPGKSDNLERLTKIFEINFARISVPFDSVPEFPEFLVEWKAPFVFACILHPPPRWLMRNRDRSVVRTLRCGRSNPGSIPGHGISFLFFSS